MSGRALFAFVLGCVVIAASQPARAIVEGEPARDPSAERAIVVRIESTRGELCSGVLMNRQWVLTAAHCLLGGGRFSVMSLDRSFRSRRHGIDRMVIHPSFVPGTTPRTQPGTDLAMIRLTAPVPDDLAAASIGSGLWTGETITISGYGLSAERRRGSIRQLISARLVTAGTYTSANSVTVAVDGTSKGHSAGAGACRGDSGGPALRGGSSSRDLVGIVSWSSGPLAARDRRVCGGFTSITPVADHTGWIARTMAEPSGGGTGFGPAPAGSAMPWRDF